MTSEKEFILHAKISLCFIICYFPFQFCIKFKLKRILLKESRLRLIFGMLFLSLFMLIFPPSQFAIMKNKFVWKLARFRGRTLYSEKEERKKKLRGEGRRPSLLRLVPLIIRGGLYSVKWIFAT